MKSRLMGLGLVVALVGAAAPAYADFDADCGGWSKDGNVWLQQDIKLYGFVTLVRMTGPGSYTILEHGEDEVHLPAPGGDFALAGAWNNGLPAGDYAARISVRATILTARPYTANYVYTKHFSCADATTSSAQLTAEPDAASAGGCSTTRSSGLGALLVPLAALFVLRRRRS